MGRLGLIWPVISKLKVNTGLFTNDFVNFPYIYFGLPYLRREILNVFKQGLDMRRAMLQEDLTGCLYLLRLECM